MDQRTFRKINVDIEQRIINGINYSTFDDQETQEKDSRKRNQKYETIHGSDDNKDSWSNAVHALAHQSNDEK